MTKHLLAAAALIALSVPTLAQEEAAPAPSPNEIIAAAPDSAWIAIEPEDLVVMRLAPDRDGNERTVVMQLMPPPFSQGWIANIRTLARAEYWDGSSINRVQDNYVVQWGQPDPGTGGTEKPVPEGLNVVPESEYVAKSQEALRALMASYERQSTSRRTEDGKIQQTLDASALFMDPYAKMHAFSKGWPIAFGVEDQTSWPVHCYGMVGVGRNLSPDTGDGSQLYTVIGHAPRHLDRNIALVGRIVSGIEHLSSLPRGTGGLGVYETAEQRTPIEWVRVASDLPEAERPAFEYFDTATEDFARYAEARANRRDPFFNVPAGGADVCNIPVPVRAVDG